MQNYEQLLNYIQKGVNTLVQNGAFEGGQAFRRTQKQALEAYSEFLSSDISTEEKLKGFFEIPTGVGKTAVFVGIVGAAHKEADKDGVGLKTAIVVPTTQLLDQTIEAIEAFSPSLKGKIGQYGDGPKDLSSDITVMTYNAWLALSETGDIGSHNIDILISDEAHRGTSDRKVDLIKGVFSHLTLQLAFTATAHFDQEKSVQASHGHNIFFKGISDAVKEGELVSYVQSQRAVIRAEPTEFMLSGEFENASKSEKSKHTRKLKQKTWNKFALKVFREGRDERTGDLLSDNQAGFFVDGIAQANQLEKMLNADQALQKRAHDQGYEGVAVAIHSALSPKEQARRFEAYKAGKYLAVIGDEKFKEGFDHPPMKTVVDYPHASLVDKAQILGRGARKWWNDCKARWEGLTIIDTAIYVGSEDKDEDERLRLRALTGVITVKDILEDAYVLGPEAPKDERRIASGGKGHGSIDIFRDDPNIEYYATVEDIYQLDALIQEAQKGKYVELTPELVEQLNKLFEAANVTTYGFAKNFDLPEGLHDIKLLRWVTGYAKFADPEHLQFVRNGLQEIIEGNKKVSVNAAMSEIRMRRNDPGRVPLTSEMRQELKRLADETGMASTQLLKHADENKPTNLTRTTISSWLKEETRTVDPESYNYTLALYEKVLENLKNSGLDHSKVEITPELHEEIVRLSKSIGQAKVTKQPDVPEGVKRSLIYCWVTRQATTAKKYQLDYVMNKWYELEQEQGLG